MNFKLGLLTASCLLAFTQLALAETVEPQSSEADLSEEQSVEYTETSVKQEQAEASAKAEALVDLEVNGIQKKDKDAWANVKIYLGQIAKEYADGSERHQYLVQTAVDKALRAKGYYNTQYQFIQTPRAGKKPLLTLNVELDRQKVKIDETDVHIMGEAGKDEEFTKLIDSVPKKGTNLDHEQYDGFKSNLESLAFKKVILTDIGYITV
ncbi:outer membrane protein and surface antigen [Actinobacillus equuli]|nr:outer membrane protein and surface antigen [Actinobacillus equuli]